ncbi:MAG: decaprenyl-phosphate phosphoribosyltransferase, partial [Muribaculaceae bacterium]|nr:decaprenyl-phosphate phosphoribosyltransferase [Muribaculaceae bacterium]
VDMELHNENGCRMRDFIRLMRPHQWIKNGVVFLPLIFGGKLLDMACVIPTFIAAIAFCFVSSSIYCLNDVRDYSDDIKDPKKRKRPVASGKVSKKEATTISLISALIGLSIGFCALSGVCFSILCIYLLLNVLYCLWLKQKMLIDVIIVALGFVLRVVMGGVAGDIRLSQWIIIMIFLLALFLALAKRRYEVVQVATDKKKSGRKSISGYNVAFLNVILSMLGAVLLIGYIIYTLQPRKENGEVSEYLYITSLPVLYGIMRYLQLTIVENRSGSPSKMAYSDVPIRLTVIIWLLMFVFIIYCL